MIANLSTTNELNSKTTTKMANQSHNVESNNKKVYYQRDRNVPNESNKFSWIKTNEKLTDERGGSDQEYDDSTSGFGIDSNNLTLYPTANNTNLMKNGEQQIGAGGLKQKINLMPGTSYYVYGNGGAIKRGCDDLVDGENDDDLITLSLSSVNGSDVCLGSNGSVSTSGLSANGIGLNGVACVSTISSSYGYGRRSPPKKPKFVVTSQEMNVFFSLLETKEIQDFLTRDACCLISDKYALAMVFTYFKRAKFNLEEYTLENFYLALYLASDIEEDVDEYKYEIFPWALGTSWRSKFSGFLRKRDVLLRRIGYRAIVSRKCCEEVMSFKSDHCVWKRERAEDHGGATRAYLISRSKRFLSSKYNIEEEELNYPRLPTEPPRPCPLCLLNRGWNPNTNSVNTSTSMQPPSTTACCTTLDINNNKVTSVTTTSTSVNHTIKTYSASNPSSPKKKVSERSVQRRQRVNNGKENSGSTSSKQGVIEKTKYVKTPKKLTKTITTTSLKSRKLCKAESDNEILSNRNFDSEVTEVPSVCKIPSANKFLNLKNSGDDDVSAGLVRHSSLVSTDRYVEQQTSDGDDEHDDHDDDDEYEDDDEEDAVNHQSESDEDDDDDEEDEVFTTIDKQTTCSNQSKLKKQDLLKSSLTARRSSKTANSNTNAAIRKRINHSLSTNSSGVTFRSTNTKISLRINSNEFSHQGVKSTQVKSKSKENYQLVPRENLIQ